MKSRVKDKVGGGEYDMKAQKSKNMTDKKKGQAKQKKGSSECMAKKQTKTAGMEKTNRMKDKMF